VTLLDNQSSFQTLATFNTGSINYVQWQFSLIRNGQTQTGRLIASTDGTTASFTIDDVFSTVDVGITFNVVVSGSNMIIQYSSTSTGFVTIMKYYEKSWI
jgi:hypothetical protein